MRTGLLWGVATFFSLAALCLAFLPLTPVRQTASTETRQVAPQNASPAPGRLLGEGSTGLAAPLETGAPVRSEVSAGSSAAMTLTVPRLGLKNVAVPTGTRQSELDDYGLMRLTKSGVPWRAGSNTYITGHALGYMRTKVPYAFYKLDKMKPGDEILIKNRAGKTYTFRVFDKMTVQPTDTWVTYPTTDGKTIVSLQSCTPIPTFQNRLIVRAELVSVG